MLNFKEIISVTLILFSVIDILGSVPIIIDLRRQHGHIDSTKATLVSAGIMIAFLFIGERLLNLFGIDVQSFALAGAVVMIIIGMEMILGHSFFKSEEIDTSGASIVPLAFPLIAGAGTLTTLVSLRAEYETQNILAGVIFNLIFVFAVLKSSGWLGKKIGPAGFSVMRKVFGIILLAISIKLIKSNIGSL
ncbi:MarC family protein [Mangrovivirga sp. M17]|uniref:UPF0056 membrane protein n=1 Tax=Mangrovivirga halotolerans TaxID=2993936 RepID=A0ABT3RVI5_9BACT|nr:MarC family protein [Mangrovivirga halotolerans]MCX2745787.1 MarC family protein [Mangrovivirga halotolerans]